MRADLHIHTDCSDGTLTATQVVERAEALGLGAIAITDHDTTLGVAEAISARRDLRVEVIPGVEINTEDVAFEVHILGYFFDMDCPELQELLRSLRRGRVERARRILAKLSAIGIDIGFEELAAREDTRALGRPHIANVLVERGHAVTALQAFRRFLKKGSPAFVERYRITPTEATIAIKEAGGVPVFAHPGMVGRDSTLRALVEVGLGGIEAYHPEHGPDIARKYERMAEELGLVATGGSDSHGDGAIRTVAIGSVTCGMQAVEALRARKGSN